jgi:hypothetical protein
MTAVQVNPSVKANLATIVPAETPVLPSVPIEPEIIPNVPRTDPLIPPERITEAPAPKA